MKLSLKDVVDSTENFSARNLILDSLFRGELWGGTVAVKVLQGAKQTDSEGFERECELL